MNNLYFSIIIPTLNEEKFLPKLLGDIKNQVDREFEVIIVDGNSEDHTRDIGQAQDKYYDVKIYKVDRRNVSFQRNYGAAKAKGEYLVFLDADAQINKFFIKNLKKTIEKKKGLIFIPAIVPDESSARPILKLVNFIIELSQLTNKPLSSGGSMVWERNFFTRVGGFDEKIFLAEDHSIIQKALKWSVKAIFMSKVKVKFSLRRMKKEGQLVLFYKLVISSAHLIIKGDIKNKIFDYRMGGAYHKLLEGGTFEQSLRKNVSQFKKFFKKYLF